MHPDTGKVVDFTKNVICEEHISRDAYNPIEGKLGLELYIHLIVLLLLEHFRTTRRSTNTFVFFYEFSFYCIV